MPAPKDIIVSGIRATGNLHLGNYFGAVRQFIQMQNEYPCYFFIADYHSLTTHPNSADFAANVRNVLIDYLACGLDPEKSVLYLQSSLPQVSELYLMLNMHAYLGELKKVPTFKDKVRSQPDNVNAGLLTYPVLMAADVLIHKATKVPVGKDQEQHLEIVKHIARRFNKVYGRDIFPEPCAFSISKKFVKIPGLDGSGKMGKSEGQNNAIFLHETPDEISKKVMRAVTDSGPTEPNQHKPESIKNLFTLMKYLSKPDTYHHFDEQYNNCTIRYGDLKKQLAADTIEFLTPIRERITELSSNDVYLNKVLKEGAEKARESADKVILEVRKAIGFVSIS
jgi:tryptophanyl-tRNA synthetase